MIWLEESGLLDVRREEVIRLAGRIPPRGVFGSEHTISLQALGAQGIVLLGRLSGVADGGRLSFADDVEANVRFGDEASDNAKRHIDDYIDRAGIDAPVSDPDPAETVAWSQPDPAIGSLDLSRPLNLVAHKLGPDAKMWPSRPKAVTTSSAIKRMSFSAQSARMRLR